MRMVVLGPLYFFTSKVASYSSHVDLSSPKYPLKALSPHGHCVGLQMGANAETDCNIRHSPNVKYITLLRTHMQLKKQKQNKGVRNAPYIC